MCCLEPWIDRAPPLGGAGPLQNDDQALTCGSIARTALSVAGIALSLFSTIVYLGTGNFVALGSAVVLGIITAIVLSQRNNATGALPHVPRIVDLFQQAVPPVPVHPLPQPIFQAAPHPVVVTYTQPEARVQVRDRSVYVGAPPMFHPSAPPLHQQPPVARMPAGEERVVVRDRSRVAPIYPPPGSAEFQAQVQPPRHTQGEERVQVRSHGTSLPFVAPQMAPVAYPQAPAMHPPGNGEARVHVRDGGRPGAAQQPDDEQRVPVGRGGGH